MDLMDDNKKSEFLKKWKGHENLIKYVWSKARFIPHNILIDNIEQSINAFMSMNIPFILFKRSYIKSNNWLSSIFYEKLKNPLTYTEDNELSSEKNTYHVVIIDDAAYTGTSMVHIICESLVAIPESSCIHIHIILGFITNIAINRIMACNSWNDEEKICIHLYAGEIIPTMREIVDKDNFNMDWNIFHLINGSKSNVTNIWFPHKIADNVSTIRGFLKDVVKDLEDRSGIENSTNFPFIPYPARP